MKNGFLLLVSLAFLATAGPSAAADQALVPGGRAPMADRPMKGVDGKTMTIAKVAGKRGTLVIFTCNSCPWVKAWEGRMVEIANGCAKRDVGVIMINSNDPGVNAEDDFGGMVARAKKLGMTFPYVVDATSEIARAFGATRTPEAYLFDAEGRLAYHGTIDDDAHRPQNVSARYLADAVDAVVAGKDVPMAETKALGCSIKFRAEKGRKTSS